LTFSTSIARGGRGGIGEKKRRGTKIGRVGGRRASDDLFEITESAFYFFGVDVVILACTRCENVKWRRSRI